VNRSEWAAARHSYRLSGRNSHLGEELPIPSWLSNSIHDRIDQSCLACQDFLGTKYGIAECTVCPLADFVRRLSVGAIRESPERINL